MIKRTLYSFLTLLIATAAVFGISMIFLAVMQHSLPISAPAASSHPSSGISSTESKEVLSSSTQSTAPLDLNEWSLILINSKHPLPEDYQVQLAKVQNVMVNQRIADPLKTMISDAQKDGIQLVISSAYRSPQRQSQLFDQAIKENEEEGMNSSEAEETAANSIAKPGYSEHSTGLAVDFNGVLENFDSTPEYRWLMEHAEKYGFILRYPKDKEEITGIRFEPWHFRYVGPKYAKKINQLNVCLEEFVTLSDLSSSE